jgi:hypothetical protein
MRACRAIAVASLVLAAGTPPAQAKPSWASAPDTRDDSGSTFVCEGSGPGEAEAFAAAQGVCNDKICRVCGVEIVSTVETQETLKGIDVQRKVVERCRRVRKGETKVRYKSVDCGPEGCTAWIQVFYSKEDEQAECPSYTRESFADSTACEQDIETFKQLRDRTAAAFRERTRLLDLALGHCADIDVRPTPAIMALDEKLRAGMDAFELTERMQQARLEEPFFETTWYKSRQDMMKWRSLEDWYLTTYQPLRQQIAETKKLADRIRLVRDYVANKALVFDVIEAARAPDVDTSAGKQRLLAALKRAPVGSQYGAPKVHFSVLYTISRLSGDTTALTRYLMAAFPAAELGSGEAFEMAKLLAGDGRIDADEWTYLFLAHTTGQKRGGGCTPCLRVALAERHHGGPSARIERFLAALASLPPKDSLRERRRQLEELVPLDDPLFVLELETHLPQPYRPTFDLELLDEVVKRFGYPPVPQEAPPIMRRVVAMLLDPAAASEDPKVGRCQTLGHWLERLKRFRAERAGVDKAVCACLDGELRGERVSSSPKADLFALALERRLPCVQ